jgi:hypothetical protein
MFISRLLLVLRVNTVIFHGAKDETINSAAVQPASFPVKQSTESVPYDLPVWAEYAIFADAGFIPDSMGGSVSIPCFDHLNDRVLKVRD